jgi:hypothetical protein
MIQGKGSDTFALALLAIKLLTKGHPEPCYDTSLRTLEQLQKVGLLCRLTSSLNGRLTVDTCTRIQLWWRLFQIGAHGVSPSESQNIITL